MKLKKTNIPTIEKRVDVSPSLKYVPKNVFILVKVKCTIRYRRLQNNEYHEFYQYHNGKRYKVRTFFGVRRKIDVIHSLRLLSKRKINTKTFDYICSNNTNPTLEELSNTTKLYIKS